eukprot:1211859-Prymnesium_polylepis.1
MALDSRPKQHSIVLGSGTVRPAGSTGQSAGAQPCSVRVAASGGMSAYNCFRCGVPGGRFILPDTFFTSSNEVVSVSD